MTERACLSLSIHLPESFEHQVQEPNMILGWNTASDNAAKDLSVDNQTPCIKQG